MSELKNKKVLLVITGGIAAYKSLELISHLNRRIDIIMEIIPKYKVISRPDKSPKLTPVLVTKTKFKNGKIFTV